MPARFITSTAFSQSAWKEGSFGSRSMGPKPCMPPRSWTPFLLGGGGWYRDAAGVSSRLATPDENVQAARDDRPPVLLGVERLQPVAALGLRDGAHLEGRVGGALRPSG